MRIAVIGAGAMGAAIGLYMIKNGVEVELVDTDPAQVAEIRQGGGRVLHGDVQRDFTVPAAVSFEMSGIYDILILTTKQTANSRILPKLSAHMRKDSVVCTLQNGIPEPSVAGTVGRERTIGGSMLFGATLVEPGVVRITTQYGNFREAAFQIGQMDGRETEKLRDLAALLGTVGGVTMINNLMETKWAKLLINCSRSGMSTALNCTFGEVTENPRSLLCALLIARECLTVCRAEGYVMAALSGEDPNQYDWTDRAGLLKSMELFKLNGAPSTALRASMLQDLKRGLPTEIDYINGLVVGLGRRHGILTPVNARVVQLVKEAQERGAPGQFDRQLRRFDDLLLDYGDLLTLTG